jgi:hypothetical protein
MINVQFLPIMMIGVHVFKKLSLFHQRSLHYIIYTTIDNISYDEGS